MLSSELIKTAYNFVAYCFGISGLFLTAKLYILDQIPNIQTDPGSSTITILLGSYLSLMLAALYKQNNTIGNIEKTMKESLDVLNKTLHRDDEKHEAVIRHHTIMTEHLKNINDTEKEQVILIREQSEINSKSDIDEAFSGMIYKQPKNKK